MKVHDFYTVHDISFSCCCLSVYSVLTLTFENLQTAAFESGELNYQKADERGNVDFFNSSSFFLLYGKKSVQC